MADPIPLLSKACRMKRSQGPSPPRAAAIEPAGQAIGAWSSQELRRFARVIGSRVPVARALRDLAQAGRDLLRRAAELPDTEQGLLLVLAEYRLAIFALVAVAAKF